MAKAIFSTLNNEFYHNLKISIDKYFESKHIKKTGNWKLYLKTFILIGTAVSCYSVLLFSTSSTVISLLLCVVLGLAFAGIGFSVMHDACHGSYSSKNWINSVLGMTLNTLGATSYFWKQKHNILHHTYPNIDGIDDDIAKSPLLRMCDSQKWLPAHRVQHIYLPFIYGITSFAWVFIMDFIKYFKRDISGTAAWKMKPINHFVFWLTKALYIFFYMVLPIILVGFNAWLIGYIVVNACLGFTLSIVFQLAHIVEKTESEFVGFNATRNFDSAWAEHQLKTTANFAMGNRVINWFVGGLNFQIEHHLFPKISHIHYPAISKIVMAKCKEYNMPYHFYRTMGSAVASHYRVMRLLGRKPVLLPQVIPAN